MAGRQTQPGRPAMRKARGILKKHQVNAPTFDMQRGRTKPGMRTLPISNRS